MHRGEHPFEVNPETTCEKIEELIRSKLDEMKRDGVIVGLSGGFDSTVVAYLSVRSVGKERVRLIYLPDRDSQRRHRQDAELAASELDIPLEEREITPVLEAVGIYDLLPLKYVPGQRLKEVTVQSGKSLGRLVHGDRWLEERLSPAPNSFTARGNAYACIKHRMRMVLLYYLAEIENLMVVGAANKTEVLTGTFSMWGIDHCADVMPIKHLYRSQLDQLAVFLGIPARIREKKADPDVMPGINNKEELLGSFREVDEILWGIEQGVPIEELYQSYGRARVEKLIALRESSRHLRLAPYIAEENGASGGA
jgi:NAD+ synthase